MVKVDPDSTELMPIRADIAITIAAALVRRVGCDTKQEVAEEAVAMADVLIRELNKDPGTCQSNEGYHYGNPCVYCGMKPDVNQVS